MTNIYYSKALALAQAAPPHKIRKFMALLLHVSILDLTYKDKRLL